MERNENDPECQYNGHRHAGSKENLGDDSRDCEIGHDVSDGEDNTVAGEDLYGDDDKEDALEAQHPTLNAEQLAEETAKLMCTEEMPFLGKGFRMFMSVACPVPLNVDSTTKACLRYFEEEKSKIKLVLNNMDRSIAISVDVLSDYKPCGSIAYFMCLQSHFIDDDWKLTKRVLCFQEYSYFIDAAILKSLKDWNIEDKVSSLTSRNADACNEVVDTIKARVVKKRTLPLSSSFFSVSCVAEMFSLMAHDAFDHISKTIDKLQWFVWSNSECMWHLTNSKLKNALDLQATGEFDSKRVPKSCNVPSAREWRKIEVVHRLVESAYNVAKLVFETKYPTANKFLYNLQELRTILIKESTSPDTFTRNVAMNMLQRLEKYLKDMFLLLAVTSVLDPRCKMQYMEYMSSKFDDVERGPVLEAIRGLYDYYASFDIEIEKSKGASNSETETETWLHEYNQFVQTKNPPKKSDLDSYLEDPVLPWTDEFNALEWWKSEAPKYPVVAKMAQDILAIPLSVATSYDAYCYLENRPPNKHVIASGPELMNALMCCRSWSAKKMP